MSLSRCMCCGHKTLGSPDTLALCPVCWWDDDGQDDSDVNVVRHTVNAGLSLAEARRNYEEFGAADASFLSHVRKPTAEEA